MAAQGLMRLTEDGYETKIPGHIPTLYYDVRAINDCCFHLWLSIDGRLTRWAFDPRKWNPRRGDAENPFVGKEWQHEHNYPESLRIEGPFVICPDERSAVAEKDKTWCIIGPFESPEPEVQPIVERSPDEPLLIIEDAVSKQFLFLQAGVLMNEDGRELRRGLDRYSGESLLSELAEYVWARQPQTAEPIVQKSREGQPSK
jgi:hypothetical protein